MSEREPEFGETDNEPGFREDCDPQCRGYWRVVDGRRTECCGGCPAQCACRLEREADDRASQDAFYEGDYLDDNDLGFAESDYGDGPGA